ncbi:hypothetical protein EDD18DRAFT_1207343, partial [Armillaria luteobubalina]
MLLVISKVGLTLLSVIPFPGTAHPRPARTKPALVAKAGVRCCDVGEAGMADLALLSSTPMGRPVTDGWMSSVRSLCNLPVRDVGPGVSGAKERCVLSTPPYRGGVVLCGRLLGAAAHIREHRESAHRLGRRQGYTACHPGSRASAVPSRRGVQAVHGSVRL